MNIGGKFNFEFGSVKVTQAIHSAGIEGGVACGFIIDFTENYILCRRHCIIWRYGVNR